MPRKRHLRANGGCDFVASGNFLHGDPVHWTTRDLPSVVVLTESDKDVLDQRFRLAFPALSKTRRSGEPDAILRRGPSAFRVHFHGNANPPAVLLPFDKLFDVRADAALRLWRLLAGRNPGPNRAALTLYRRKRLIEALRALDGRLAGAKYRQIAIVLLSLEDMTDAAWQTHDKRGKAIRLARLGFSLMQGGYRRLLLHPYRRKV